MKLLPYAVLNLVTVVVALAVYDGLRGEDAAPALSGLESGSGADVIAIDRRVGALEQTQQPVLRADGIPPALLSRLAALEARLATREEARSTDAPTPGERPTESPAPLASLPRLEEEPTAEAISAFRRLQEAALREERREKELERIDVLLAKQDIRLSPEQRDRVAAVYAAFGARRNQVWIETKKRASEAGGTVDWKAVIQETNVQLEKEFGERLARVLPSADAHAVARALSPFQ